MSTNGAWGKVLRLQKNAMKGRKEYYAFVEAQRDDVKFAVHTSPDGEPTIMSKKQYSDWAPGYTGGYLRVYPYNDVKVEDVIVQKQSKGER